MTDKKEGMNPTLIDEAVKTIQDSHHKIIDDWCKAYMAQLYEEGHELKPGCFTLNEQNDMVLSNGKFGKRYWFERGVPHYHPQEKNEEMNPKPDLNLALLAHVQKTGQIIEFIERTIEAESCCEEDLIWIRDQLLIDPYEGNL